MKLIKLLFGFVLLFGMFNMVFAQSKICGVGITSNDNDIYCISNDDQVYYISVEGNKIYYSPISNDGTVLHNDKFQGPNLNGNVNRVDSVSQDKVEIEYDNLGNIDSVNEKEEIGGEENVPVVISQVKDQEIKGNPEMDILEDNLEINPREDSFTIGELSYNEDTGFYFIQTGENVYDILITSNYKEAVAQALILDISFENIKEDFGGEDNYDVKYLIEELEDEKSKLQTQLLIYRSLSNDEDFQTKFKNSQGKFGQALDNYNNGKLDPSDAIIFYDKGLIPTNSKNLMQDLTNQLNDYQKRINEQQKIIDNPESDENSIKNAKKRIEDLNNNNQDLIAFSKRVVTDLRLISDAIANGGNLEDYEKLYKDDSGFFGKLFGDSSQDKLRQNLIEGINKNIDEIRKECDIAVNPAKCNENLKNEFISQREKLLDKFAGLCGEESAQNCNVDRSICYSQESDSLIDECLQRAFLLDEINDIEEDRELIKTNVAYDIWNALANPDARALKTARLFGIEANYNRVPKFLREDPATTICAGKIGGYYDKEIPAQNGLIGGGITGFSYELEQKFGEGITNTELNPTYELRAQRTKIAPDNTTYITYSYFIKAPANSNLTFGLALLYSRSGNIVREELQELRNIGPGKTDSNLVSLNLPINDSNQIKLDNDGFEEFAIKLLAKNNQKEKVVDITTKVLVITQGDNYNDPLDDFDTSNYVTSTSSSSIISGNQNTNNNFWG